jgi:phi LC3 family holin
MKINWKLRIKNKATLIALITTTIGLIYSILSTFGVTPTIEQSQLVEWISILIGILATLGILVDPTTSGTSDSKQALNYDEPKED